MSIGKNKLWIFLIIIFTLVTSGSFASAQVMPGAEMPTGEAADMMAPEADTTPPGFISVAAASSEENQATIVWTTDEMSYGYVEYGETTAYGQATAKSADAGMDHTETVTGLNSGTVYHYRIVAEDMSGNISYSEDRTLETAVEVVAMDNTPPEISGIAVLAINASGATVSWTTDELAQGRVEYGPTASYGAATPLAADYADEHSVALTGLLSGTEYHFRVVVQDESGNEAVSPDEVFTTEAAASEPTASTSTPAGTGTSSTATPSSSGETDINSAPFAISSVLTASVATTTAVITWETNEPADSQVWYGPGESYASSTPVAATLVSSHQITLRGLAPGTNYFYRVVSKNSAGVSASQEGFEFNTLYKSVEVSAAPEIFSVAVESVSMSSVVILWQTSKAADGEVRYGETTAYEKTSGRSTVDTTSHRQELTDLTAETLYNFEIISRDSSGDEAIYKNSTFTTKAAAAPMPSAPAKSDSAKPSELPAVQNPVASESALTPSAPVMPVSSATGKSSGSGYHPSSVIVSRPVIGVEPLDGQILFVWKSKKTSTTKIVITRNAEGHPVLPSKVNTIYIGDSGRFVETGLTNGQVYYYSVFKVNKYGKYSQPVRFSVRPRLNADQVKLNTVPPVIQQSAVFVFKKAMRLGDKNHHIEHLQILLAGAAFYPEALITGYFGPLTEKAVKVFQKHYNLAVTGIIDGRALKILETLSRVEIVKTPAISVKQWQRNLDEGMSGDDVTALQEFLVGAGVYPEELITGYFGPLTRQAVKEFQTQQNIYPSVGFFGPVTRHRVAELTGLSRISF